MAFLEKPKRLVKRVSKATKQVDNVATELKSIKLQNNRLQERLDTLTRDLAAMKSQRDYMFWTIYKRECETFQEAKERFFLDLPKEGGEMGLKQDCIKILMREFGRICREHNIEYWLDHGTLLGAVRHHGFIPWDDDADVGMLRSEISKLKPIIEESDILEFIDFQAVTTNSVCQIYRIGFKHFKNPCFIDIFIHDSIGEQKLSDKETWEVYRRYRRELIARGEKMWTAEDRKNSPYRNEPDGAAKNTVASSEVVSNILLLKNEILKRLGDELGFSPSLGESIIWGVDNFTFGKPRIFPTNWIYPLQQLEFEGELYLAPADTAHFLEDRYGNIWEMPNNMIAHQHLHLSREEREVLEATIKEYEAMLQ